MENLPLALKISGVGILVLLLVLILLAVVVYLMTRFIVEKPEVEEKSKTETVEPVIKAVEEPRKDLALAAAIAIAIARAQSEVQAYSSESAAGEVNSWREFGLQRRLTQSSTIRRTR